MHIEILSDKQTPLLPFVSQFKRSFYLVGGTAIALHIGHRKSIDFDLFSPSKLNKANIKQAVSSAKFNKRLIGEDVDQIHFVLNDVKVTFFNYPYIVPHLEKFKNIITMPSLISLAAMKAFALGRRAKWKDYIDLYFILKYHFSLREITEETNKIFDQLFSEKLFREQLTIHKDIDFTEKVEFLPGFEVDENEVKAFLIDVALKGFG